jgi:hypothetical protein
MMEAPDSTTGTTEHQLTTADLAGKTANLADRQERTDAMPYDEYDDTQATVKISNGEIIPPVEDPHASLPVTATTGMTTTAEPAKVVRLFSDGDIGDLRSRWTDVQARFVDEPRRSVEEADELVATVMQRLAEGFSNERASLEKQWDSGDSISTEDLRVALQRYRAFFGRLLNAA